PQWREPEPLAVGIAQDQPPANRAHRKRQCCEAHLQEEQPPIGVLRRRPDLPWIDPIKHPYQQGRTEGKPDQPGPPSAPAVWSTRARWRGQRDRRLRR